MKRVLAISFLLLSAVTLQAQDFTGSVEGLAREGKAKLVIDYSEALIHGMSEQEFAVYEQDWYDDKYEIMGKFQSSFAEELDDYLVCHRNVKSPFTIVVKVNKISKKGNTVLSMHIFEDDGSGNENEVATIIDLEGDGGTFGTKLNLIKDGAVSTGENAG